MSGSTAVLPGPGPDAAAAVLLLSDQRSPLPLGSQSSGSLQGPHSGSLQPQRSGSLPLPPSSGSSLPGRPGSSDTPMFTECELAALRLSDWEIRPEGMLMRAAGWARPGLACFACFECGAYSSPG